MQSIIPCEAAQSRGKVAIDFSFAFSMPLCLCPSATNQLHPEPVRLPLRLRSGLRLIQGKLRRRGSRRALISNSLINSPFAPMQAALCLCRKASAGRHPVECGLASMMRRGAFATTSCLLFSTGWALIMRAKTWPCSAGLFIPLLRGRIIAFSYLVRPCLDLYRFLSLTFFISTGGAQPSSNSVAAASPSRAICSADCSLL